MKGSRWWPLGLLWVALAAPVAATPGILVLGDSISAGYGIDPEQGWVALLEQRLRARGHPHRVVNASISGDTSSAGLARLPAALEAHQSAILVIELGGNDGLRGLPSAALRRNLSAMVKACRARDCRAVLLGMRIPSNYGPAYSAQFEAAFAAVAADTGVPWLPFFLDGVAQDAALMQDDGIHPNAAAQPLLLEHAWPLIEPLLSGEGS